MDASHRPWFQIEESTDQDGAVRLALVGELDIASVDELSGRLNALKQARRFVYLDLSRLNFMDSTGLGTMLEGVLDAQRDGWHLEVGHELTGSVQRLVEIAGVASYLWPEP